MRAGLTFLENLHLKSKLLLFDVTFNICLNIFLCININTILKFIWDEYMNMINIILFVFLFDDVVATFDSDDIDDNSSVFD